MAPIFIKEYNWLQTYNTVTINVPLKRVCRKDIDLFTCATYIKANAPPFIFEIFLYAEIVEAQSKCSFTEESMVFELLKVEEKEWPKLDADISYEDKIKIRQRYVSKKHQQEADQRKARSQKFYDLKQFAIQKQIGLGSAQNKAVEDVKNLEKEKVNQDLTFLKKLQMSNSLVKVEEEKCLRQENENKTLAAEYKRGRDLIEEKDGTEEISRNRAVEPIVHKAGVAKPSSTSYFPFPLPRQPGNIQVNFTVRHFPTPTRESKLAEEQEWLKKQFEARKASGFVAEDLRPEECDPVWLKDKGDTFYGHDNFLGAISAYSHAIKIGSKMPGLYSNRSAAHFRLGNLHKALEDCSTALELLTPRVPGNEEARLTCHIRRGVILSQLGLPEKALPDFEEALAIRPNDKELLDDFERAKRMVEDAGSGSD